MDSQAPWDHLIRVQCPICLDYFKLPTKAEDDFVTFPCRHGICKKCLAESHKNTQRRNRPACFVCRQPYRQEEAHHLYLTIEDAKIVSINTTVEKMSEMGAESKLISVKTAGDRIRRASETLSCHEDTAKDLLRAVDEFRERIIPVFGKVGAQANEILRLKEDLQKANQENAQFKRLAASSQAKDQKLAELHAELEGTRTISNQALEHAERASNEIQQLRAQSDRYGQKVKEQEHEITRLKGLLEQHNKQASYAVPYGRAQKSKIKGLKDELARLKQSEQEQESLSLHDEGQLRTPSPSSPSPLNSPSHSPSSHTTIHHDKENTHIRPRLDYEGMPAPGFSSDWTQSQDTKEKAELYEAEFFANPTR
ncbi:spectrin repeat containing protein [Moniliophthora roreri]|nr:spectrin repeat containing protein [Moniliophthora roreri]